MEKQENNLTLKRSTTKTKKQTNKATNKWIINQKGSVIYIVRTTNRLMVAFDSNKGPNLKVVKWC